MKLKALWLLVLVLSSSVLYAGEAGEVRAIEQKITEKEGEKIKAESALKKAAQEAETAKTEREKDETEKKDLLEKPEGQRDQTVIDKLSDKIATEQKAEEQAKSAVEKATATEEQLQKDIASLKKQEEQIQEGFKPSGGGGSEASFIEKLFLKVGEWSKRLSLAWGLGEVKQLRTDLGDIYKKLGDPFSQATNARALAQELPALTDKIGKDLEALNLLNEANKLGQNKELIQREVEATVNDLVTLREKLTTEKLADKSIRDAIDNKIDQVLKDLGFSEMQIKQLTQKPTLEQEAYGKEIVQRFFDSPSLYDGFKEIRDTVIDEIQKDPLNAEKGENYQELLKRINEFELVDLTQFVPEERANIASLIKLTYQYLAQTYYNAAVEIGRKSNISSAETNSMLDLFNKNSDLFERSQAWDITLQEAFEQERQEAKNDPNFQKLVEENKDAKIISKEISEIVARTGYDVNTLKEALDNPEQKKEFFDSFITRIDRFINAVENADPSIMSVVNASGIALSITELINAIEEETKSKDLPNSIVLQLAKWIAELNNRRIRLLADENVNQNYLDHVLPNNKVVELPQVKRSNITSPIAQTNSGKALLKSIQEGIKLKTTAERVIEPKEEENFAKIIADALATRREVIKDEGEETGDEGSGWEDF